MWTLEELLDKEEDSIVKRNGFAEIEAYQDEDIPGRSDYDHMPNVNYRPENDIQVSINKYLIEYVRKNNRDKKGVLIAVKHDDNTVVIGWSLCCPLDKFDKYFGHEVAYERGCKRFYDDYHFEDVPPSIMEQLDNFVDRCKKYFKDCSFPAWTISI